MKCLFLDPASNIGALACVDGDKASVAVEMDKRITDSQIVPFVERALEKAGWTYKDLTHVASVTGPGGFTSLRTGIGFANVLQDQLDIPAGGIHLSDLYAARVSDADWIWVHSTRIDQLFIRGFGSFAVQWPEPTLVSVDDIAKDIPPGTLWAGELIPRHREKLTQIKEADPVLLADVLPGLLPTLSFEKKALLPWYGRGL